MTDDFGFDPGMDFANDLPSVGRSGAHHESHRSSFASQSSSSTSLKPATTNSSVASLPFFNKSRNDVYVPGFANECCPPVLLGSVNAQTFDIINDALHDDHGTDVLSLPDTKQVILELFKKICSRAPTPFDSTLLLAKRGLEIARQCLPPVAGDHPHVKGNEHSNGSTGLAQACVHITSLVLSCYADLRRQLHVQVPRSAGEVELIRIGEFRVEGLDIHQELMVLVMSKEIECCRQVVGRLKAWVEQLEKESEARYSLLHAFMDGLVVGMESLEIASR